MARKSLTQIEVVSPPTQDTHVVRKVELDQKADKYQGVTNLGTIRGFYATSPSEISSPVQNDVAIKSDGTQIATYNGATWVTSAHTPHLFDVYTAVDQGRDYYWNGSQYVVYDGRDTPAEILAKLLTVDENDSGLNANTLQGSTLATITAAIALKLNTSAYTAADILAKLLTVDENTSGLNANTLQGSTLSDISSAIALKLNTSAYTAADILAKLLTVDGKDSGLDADKLQGVSLASFRLPQQLATSGVNVKQWRRFCTRTLASSTGSTNNFCYRIVDSGNNGSWPGLIDGVLLLRVRADVLYGRFYYLTANGAASSSLKIGYTGAITMGSVLNLWVEATGFGALTIAPLATTPSDVINEAWTDVDPGLTYITSQNLADASTLGGVTAANFSQDATTVTLKGASNVAGVDNNLGQATVGSHEYLATIKYNETTAGNWLRQVTAFAQFYGMADTRNGLIQSGVGPIKLYKYTGADGFLHLWIPTAAKTVNNYPSVTVNVIDGYAAGAYTQIRTVTATTLADAPTQTLIEIPDKTPAPASGSVSTAETEIGVWVDGTTKLYQRTISVGPLPNATTKTVALGFTIVNFAGAHGSAKNPSNGDLLLLPHTGVYQDDAFNVELKPTTTQLLIKTSNNLSAYTQAYVTVEYTK
jgi:uncharacterized protein YjlB